MSVDMLIPRNGIFFRYGGELLPKLVPSLSGLSTNLENLEWLVNINSTVGDLVNSTPFNAVSYTHLTLPTKRIV